MDFYTVFFIYLYRVYFWNAYGTSILAMRLEDKLFAPTLIVSLIHGKLLQLGILPVLHNMSL